MRNLRQGFERFCFRNRNKGIPNLMLYIVLGNALVILMSMANGGSALYELLRFDRDLILQGQVWRLVTYVFTQSGDGFLSLIFLYFFYMLGKHVENSMGTFKFNLYYLCGVVLMDIFAMIYCPSIVIYAGGYVDIVAYTYLRMAYYLHLSLILTFATLHPDSQFMILFIIPIRGRVLALIYLAIELIDIYNLSYPVMYFPHNLFPLVALANYLLFMGSDLKNLLPISWQIKRSRNKNTPPKRTGTIPFSPSRSEYKATPKDYNHRCTICGRTDTEFPDLEFRYCSRCNGYHCYCEDHINNHQHIEE